LRNGAYITNSPALDEEPLIVLCEVLEQWNVFREGGDEADSAWQVAEVQVLCVLLLADHDLRGNITVKSAYKEYPLIRNIQYMELILILQSLARN